MSLDLARVVTQVSSMVARLRDSRNERQQRFQYALDTLHRQATQIDELKRKIAAARTTWLVGEPVERLDNHYPSPPPPPDFTVMATDGSQIEVDRHRAARCYLLNIGSAVIHYGSSPGATLESSPHLYSEDKDLVITPSTDGNREQPVEGVLLNIKRSVEECRHISLLAAQLPPESTALALMDGTLILWGLEAYPEFVTEEILYRGYLTCLEAIRKLSDRKLALASYISLPRSTEVVNVLRVAICPHEPVNCDRCSSRECQVVAGVQDRELFLSLLNDGERSALFISRSSIVQKHYGEHQVYFFYLRTGDEIARVEIPRWVATDTVRLNLAHSLILDQCRRGHGYPVALSEAHEQAVVTNADKEQFWQLVESTLIAEHLPTIGSAKSQSKRTRWV